MKVIVLERRTPRGLGFRLTLDTTDPETHDVLSAVHADCDPDLHDIVREALKQIEPIADALLRDQRLRHTTRRALVTSSQMARAMGRSRV